MTKANGGEVNPVLYVKEIELKLTSRIFALEQLVEGMTRKLQLIESEVFEWR